MPSFPTSILVTGGAGFVGSAVALALKMRVGGGRVVALDNLRRRGSERNVARLLEAGVEFAHGDVRLESDIAAVGRVELIVDCSAEPSVLAGVDAGQRYVIDTNLGGTVACLEHARRHGAGVLFLSTSRVYPYDALSGLDYEESESRLEPAVSQKVPGVGPQGVTEAFPLEGVRSLYGATKLASELLLAEYGASFGIPWIVDRCGVIAGPGQWGKVDQGFVTLWLSRHEYDQELTYIGFGGEGKQVRDVLHVDDLVDLALLQIERLQEWSGRTFNGGGGRERSTSLVELTATCRELTGQVVFVGSEPETRPNDLPWYVTDTSALREATGWRPSRSLADVLEDTLRWIRDGGDEVRAVLQGG